MEPLDIHELITTGVITTEKACEGKLKYQTDSMARWIAGKRATVKRHALAVYRCPFCGHWHLTKNVTLAARLGGEVVVPQHTERVDP